MKRALRGRFAEMQDEELNDDYDPNAEDVWTKLQHYLYALRHTVHHNGELAALADIMEVPSGDWDSWVMVGEVD